MLQNLLGQLKVGRKLMCYCTVLALFIFYLRAISQYNPQGAYIWKGNLRLFPYKLEGLTFYIH